MAARTASTSCRYLGVPAAAEMLKISRILSPFPAMDRSPGETTVLYCTVLFKEKERRREGHGLSSCRPHEPLFRRGSEKKPLKGAELETEILKEVPVFVSIKRVGE
jgi:hypothetical protein